MAQAAFVMKNLLEERAHLAVYDPQVKREQMFRELCYHGVDESR